MLERHLQEIFAQPVTLRSVKTAWAKDDSSNQTQETTRFVFTLDTDTLEDIEVIRRLARHAGERVLIKVFTTQMEMELGDENKGGLFAAQEKP